MSLQILVVEDHPDIRDLLKLRLELWGYQVCTAADGEEGLLSAVHGHFDVVLLDMALPKMDGFEVARRLRQHPATLKMPVLALTALGQASDKARCLSSGCSDYMQKPFSFDALKARIVALTAHLRTPASIA